MSSPVAWPGRSQPAPISHEKLNHAPRVDVFILRFQMLYLLVFPIPIYLIERYLLAGGGVSTESGQTHALLEHATCTHCAELWDASHRDDSCGAGSGPISVYPSVHFCHAGESEAQTVGLQTR